MAAITPSAPGGDITYVAANAGGDTMPTGHRLHVKNGGGAPITVTITAFGPCSHGSLHDMQFTVGAGAGKFINPPDPVRFANSSGLIEIEYSAVTSVTVAALAT